MRWLERIESRISWIAIPGLFKYLTLLGVVIFAAQWADPKVPLYIAFDRDKILAGEFWRIFTFAFAPMGTFGFSVLGVLFLFFAVMIAFLVSDSLEQVWGPTRTTLYLLTAWILLVAGQFIVNLGPLGLSSGSYLYSSMFLAFATYFPRYEFRLFLFLPVQVRFLAWILLGFMLLSVLSQPWLAAVVVPTLLPYAIFVLPGFLGERKALAQSAQRRRKFTRHATEDHEPFHRCAHCGRTDVSNPELDYRTLPDGTEYCVEHLPED